MSNQNDGMDLDSPRRRRGDGGGDLGSSMRSSTTSVRSDASSAAFPPMHPAPPPILAMGAAASGSGSGGGAGGFRGVGGLRGIVGVGGVRGGDVGEGGGSAGDAMGSSFTTVGAESDDAGGSAARRDDNSDVENEGMGSDGEEASPAREADAAAAEKRRAIQSIMRDATLTDLERRLRIQQLMDGSSRASNNDVSSGGGGYLSQPASSSGGGINGISGGIRSLMSSNGGISAASLNGLRTTVAAARSANSTSSASAGGAATTGAGGGGEQEPSPCVHYDRKCNVVAPCCGRAFGCRVCHDEMSSACGPMDRFAIREVVCKECGTRQGSKTNSCSGCGVTFAEYHCPKCNIWMALNKRPFHCDECGFCRVGGRDNFRHCAQCCMCISVTVYETHNCMTDKYKNNCPVCREDMFSSRQSPQDLPCGHAIHAHCFRNLAGFDYRCPICKKTVVSRTSMSAAWHARARDIEMQPMPEDLARVVNIMCNDCERKSENRNWHFLGVQCPGCSSFNTVVENVISGNGNVPARSASDGGGGDDENESMGGT